MKYPKPVMSLTEMAKLGFSRTQLNQAAHHPLADKYMMTTANGGKFLFDTEKFERYRTSVWRKS